MKQRQTLLGFLWWVALSVLVGFEPTRHWGIFGALFTVYLVVTAATTKHARECRERHKERDLVVAGLARRTVAESYDPRSVGSLARGAALRANRGRKS